MKNSLIIFFFVCSGFLFSQNSELIKRIEILSKKGIIVEDQDLEKLSNDDFKILDDYNFDRFRYVNAEKYIRLLNGPIIKLFSVWQLERIGIPIDGEVVKRLVLKNENSKNDLILQLNIGLGVQQVDKLH